MKNKQTKRIRLFGRILAMVMVLCMVFGFTVTSNAASVSKEAAAAKNGVVQIQVWFSDPETASETPLHYGTGFLVNSNTVVTCQHVATGFPDSWYVEWAQATNEALGLKRTAAQIKENLELRIMLYRGTYVKAKLKNSNPDLDLAILELSDKIDRVPLTIRSSEELEQTEDVFAIGYPADLGELDDKQTYEVDDIVVTSGSVNKISDMTFETTEGHLYDSVNCIVSSALISGGNSGGPLVDADGNVVGINAAGDGATRNIAVSSKELMHYLDALGVSYGTNSKPITEEDEEEKDTTSIIINIEDETEEVVSDVKAEEKDDKEESDDSNIMMIAIIAAAAVVVIVLIIVLIVALGKKKPAPAPAPVQYAQPPVAPQQPVRPAAPAPAPVARPAAPVAPVSSETTVLNQSAGETTVLSGGAGETTVLSNNVNGGTLVRSSNNERIPICAAEFTVGRERSSVDYCVGGNTNISRVHARFVVRDGATYIVDNKAANGTFVNGVKARAGQEIELKNGDKILLADEKFEFNK